MNETIIIVGYVAGAAAALAGLQPEDSVIWVEEPDVVRKRNARADLDASPYVRTLIEWEHGLPGKADEFYLRHRDLDPAAVIPLTEYATPFAARLAERYRRPGAGATAAQLLRDKAMLRQVSRAAGVANPESVAVDSPAQVRALMRELGAPVVLKPANRQAAVGTRIIHDPADVEAAWAECIVQDEGVRVPDRPMPLRMLAERYVHGSEYSCEMLVRDGAGVWANVTGKRLFPGDRPVESGHVVPADLPAALTERIVAQTRLVVEAVDFRDGIVHCEWIVSGDTPYLVECAGRLPGDGLVMLIARAYPIKLLHAYYALLKGRPLPELPQRAAGAAAIRFLTTPPGVVTEVRGVAAAAATAGVVECDISAAPGARFDGLRSSWDRAGDVMVVADTPAEALRLADAAAALVEIDVRPVGEAAEVAVG
ncbi:ATP-grasp domain-containing protein [Dactylosporangium sp. NPDC048998]|uniref:ATP-grasp domain-containing protein n=1 Tax=Dactylosporangium sp. NPDC048998 TaxID=3363976 RepID=UPI0037122CCF